MAHAKKQQGRPAHKPSEASTAASAGKSAGSTLRAFYVELSSNLDTLTAFIADPLAIAKREGLGEEEMELLFSGDQGRIYESLRPDLVFSTPQPQSNPGQAEAAAQAASATAPAAQAAPVPAPQPGWGVAQASYYGQPQPSAYPYGYGWPGYWPAGSGYYPDPYASGTSPCSARPQEEKR